MGRLEKIDLRDEINSKRFLKRISTNLVAKFGPLILKIFKLKFKDCQEPFFLNLEKMHIDLYMTVFLNQLGLISVEHTSQKTVKYFLLDIIRNQKFEFLTKGQKETLSVRLL